MTDIDKIAARHVPMDRWQDGVGWCDCSGRWPCDTARVLEALRAERERVTVLEPALGIAHNELRIAIESGVARAAEALAIVEDAFTTAPARRYHDPSECPHLAWVQHEGRCTGCNGPAVEGQSDA
jgi:hypothetical protein